jgi:hypothetical protein
MSTTVETGIFLTSLCLIVLSQFCLLLYCVTGIDLLFWSDGPEEPEQWNVATFFKASVLVGTFCTFLHILLLYKEFRANGGTLASIILRYLSDDTKRLLFETSLAQLLDDFARNEQDKIVGWTNTLGFYIFSPKTERWNNFLRRVPAGAHFIAFRPGLIWLFPSSFQKLLLPAVLSSDIDQFVEMSEDALASFTSRRVADSKPIALDEKESVATRLSASIAAKLPSSIVTKGNTRNPMSAPLLDRPTIDPFLQLMKDYWERRKSESEFLKQAKKLDDTTLAHMRTAAAALLCILFILPSSR